MSDGDHMGEKRRTGGAGLFHRCPYRHTMDIESRGVMRRACTIHWKRAIAAGTGAGIFIVLVELQEP